jgi:hypothetical protein
MWFRPGPAYLGGLRRLGGLHEHRGGGAGAVEYGVSSLHCFLRFEFNFFFVCESVILFSQEAAARCMYFYSMLVSAVKLNCFERVCSRTQLCNSD